MPTFSPLAATNEKIRPLDAIWNEEDDEEQAPVAQNRSCVLKVINNSYAQHIKLFVLAFVALIHFWYLNEFLVKFAAFDKMAQDVRYVKPYGTNYANDYLSIQYTHQALIDYKKNLWLTVGAMCASLAATASLLTIYSSPHDGYNRAATNLIRIFDFSSFLFITFLLFARISYAIRLSTNAQPSLRAASRISQTIFDEFGATLDCRLHPTMDEKNCASEIVTSAFPLHFLEYLVILCVLTAAYIGLAYLIEWCIRHYFPPTHEKLTPISAISRNLVASSRCSSDNSVLIAA
ncbi:hypothetical protein L5515_014502 [Caenorhabditis briggsae]|nr:hypothetical protein L3Y34_018378 [Caenorhabditis briggsae]UMM18428.1 hypothetical protein L5515_014502 [Caenorhabditis briggsae]